MLFSQLIL